MRFFNERTLTSFFSTSRLSPSTLTDTRSIPLARQNPLKSLLLALAKTAGRLYPFYRGKDKILDRPFFRWLARDLPEVHPVRLRSGMTLLVKPQEAGGQGILYWGDMDRVTTWVCKRVLEPGDTVIDIGANIGAFALTAASLVGKHGRVHAFEPQPQLAQLLEQSCTANKVSHLSLHRVALSNKAAQIEMFLSRNNSTVASLEKNWISSPDDKIVVDCETFDHCAERFDIGRVKMMKIDVEGHEGAVLEGALSYLKQSPPQIILVEAYPKADGSSDTLNLLINRLGYQVYGLSKGLLSPHLVAMPTSSIRGPQRDFVAVHPEAAAKVLPRLGIRVEPAVREPAGAVA